MTLELHVEGPGIDAVRLLQPGDAELVLGRDADCSVRLPDPHRNVSRRHLAVWNQAGNLHFRVLSVVNGVEMPFGLAPPGAQGVLAPGEVLKVGDYSVQVRPAKATQDESDPWAVLERGVYDGGGDPTAPRAALASTQAEGFAATTPPAEEDPFGDWGFESTFGPGSSGAGLKAVAQGPGAGDLSSFYKGLGLDTSRLAELNPGELEAVGRAVRVALTGLFELYSSRSGVSQGLRAEERTTMSVKDNNPLKTDWPEQTKLQYLFGGRAASIGFVGPLRAVTDLVTELLAHDAAVGAATRAAVEGTVQEFEPAALRARLLGSGSKLFEGTRTWEAYTRYYAERGQALPEWSQQLLDKYFTEAYLRESQRIKRETGSGSG